MAVTEERQRAPAMIEGIGRGSGTVPVVARLAGGRIAARRIGRQPRRDRGAEQSDSGIADASAGASPERRAVADLGGGRVGHIQVDQQFP